MASPVEIATMSRAIDRAAAARGISNPNPSVGAIVLGSDGTETAVGLTAPIGGPHAEVVALTAAGPAARGATLVVTLEPCSHLGRTGPCTAAIIAAGIARVVVAALDPTGAGGGAELLRAAGVEVETGVLATEAHDYLEPWLVARTRNRPYLTWKYAATLDGRTAASDGTSQWITGPDARTDVHRLRLQADAVLAGIGTVLADDPSLTVRAVPAQRAPLRVVVDSDARTPLSAQVLDDAAPTLIAVAEDAPAERVAQLQRTAADVIELPRVRGHVDLIALLLQLQQREVQIGFLEGGATLAAGFVRAGLVDRVIGYYAPSLLGAGTPLLHDIGVDTVEAVRRLEIQRVDLIGADVRVIARSTELIGSVAPERTS
jgi:diaminohydroxyphosphoribosylaminopyrimidine deaminase / 5-amino-6-(5-phosphoribosylamino)uracil reductase